MSAQPDEIETVGRKPARTAQIRAEVLRELMVEIHERCEARARLGLALRVHDHREGKGGDRGLSL